MIPSIPQTNPGLDFPFDQTLTGNDLDSACKAVYKLIEESINNFRQELFTDDVTQAKVYELKLEEALAILALAPDAPIDPNNPIAIEAADPDIGEGATAREWAQKVADNASRVKDVGLTIDRIRLKAKNQLGTKSTLGEMFQVREDILNQLETYRSQGLTGV